MEIWAWRSEWNAPRRIDASEDKVAAYADDEDNDEVILFFAELVSL